MVEPPPSLRLKRENPNRLLNLVISSQPTLGRFCGYPQSRDRGSSMPRRWTIDRTNTSHLLYQLLQWDIFSLLTIIWHGYGFRKHDAPVCTIQRLKELLSRAGYPTCLREVLQLQGEHSRCLLLSFNRRIEICCGLQPRAVCQRDAKVRFPCTLNELPGLLSRACMVPPSPSRLAMWEVGSKRGEAVLDPPHVGKTSRP
ncbi:hypothetical protein GQ53DRAFT_243724 [Thozetella sp. PMI_491]|nr:hypothetical protein GQ53DRAFT_243724 [Thozetella sp. PMI_491]